MGQGDQFDYGSEAFTKRLTRMFDFGYQAMVFLKFAATGTKELFPGMTKLNVSALIYLRADAEAAAGRSIVDAANFRRVWRPSLPIIHIAAAWWVQQQNYERAGRVIDQQAFFHERGVIEDWVRQAVEIEPFALKAFPKIGDQQVRSRLA